MTLRSSHWQCFYSDSGSFCGAFFLEPVAVAADVDDGRSMQQPVERSGGHDGIIREDLPLVGEGFVTGEDDGLALFIAFADGLDEKAGVCRLQRQIADFVDDKQLGPDEILDLAGKTVLRHCLGHAAGQIDGGSKVDAVSHVCGKYTQRDGQVCFATPGGPSNTTLRPSWRKRPVANSSTIRLSSEGCSWNWKSARCF